MKTESYKIDYALGTPSEISAFLLKDFKHPSEFTSHAKFRDCDMTVYEEFEGSLENEASRQSGWCGVKKPIPVLTQMHWILFLITMVAEAFLFVRLTRMTLWKMRETL